MYIVSLSSLTNRSGHTHTSLDHQLRQGYPVTQLSSAGGDILKSGYPAEVLPSDTIAEHPPFVNVFPIGHRIHGMIVYIYLHEIA